MGKGKRVYLRDGLVNSWKTLVLAGRSRARAGFRPTASQETLRQRKPQAATANPPCICRQIFNARRA